jgi:hypothetical protein
MSMNTEMVRRARDTAKSHQLYAFTTWFGANVIQTSLLVFPFDLSNFRLYLYICTGVQWVLWLAMLIIVTRLRKKSESP